MKKTMCILGVSLCLPLISEAWGTRHNFYYPQQESENSNTNIKFPFSVDKEWFTNEGYLLWKTFQGDMAYTVSDQLHNPNDSKVKIKNPQYNWGSGVRVGFGKYLPHHDLWDISFYTTYFYNDASQSSSALQDVGGLNPTWARGETDPQSDAHLSARLNYFTFDLSLRRAYRVLPTIAMCPYVGLRIPLIYQEYNTRYSQDFTPSTAVDFLSKVKTNIDNDFWGIGPHVGANFVWNMKKHWSVLGNFAGAFIWGQQTVKQKSTLTRTTVATGNTIPTSLSYSDTSIPLRFNLEGSIGLGWEKWVKNHTIRIAPAFMFEGTFWSAMNQVTQIPPTGSNQLHANNANLGLRHHGNLAMMGFSFDLRVDF